LINQGRRRYVWVTLLPLSFLTVIELTAGYQNIRDNYLPRQLYLNTAITFCLIAGLLVVLGGSLRKWRQGWASAS
jgi:carbon starvation protein